VATTRKPKLPSPGLGDAGTAITQAETGKCRKNRNKKNARKMAVMGRWRAQTQGSSPRCLELPRLAPYLVVLYGHTRQRGKSTTVRKIFLTKYHSNALDLP